MTLGGLTRGHKAARQNKSLDQLRRNKEERCGVMAEAPKTYRDFWPCYLKEHSQPATRALHFAGTGTCLLWAALAFATGYAALAPLALVPAYGAAWAGHAFIEKNRPLTFTYPLWSLVSDFRMAGLWCVGRLGATYKKHGLAYRPAAPGIPE